MTIEMAEKAIATRLPWEYAVKHNLLMVIAVIIWVLSLYQLRTAKRRIRYGLKVQDWKKLDKISKREGIPPEKLAADAVRAYIEGYNRKYEIF